MCDYSVILSYRSGRYDCLGMLIVAFAFWSFSFQSEPGRLMALTIAGAASPWIGLQLLPLEAALGAMLLAFTFFRYWREVLIFFSGFVIGGLGLIRFFTSHGVLNYFLAFLHSQSQGPRFVVGLLHGHFGHFNVLPKDFSLPLVLSSAVLLATVLHGLQRSSIAVAPDVWIDIRSIVQSRSDCTGEISHLLRMDDVHTSCSRGLRKLGLGFAHARSRHCRDTLCCGMCCGSGAALTCLCQRLERS